MNSKKELFAAIILVLTTIVGLIGLMFGSPFIQVSCIVCWLLVAATIVKSQH